MINSYFRKKSICIMKNLLIATTILLLTACAAKKIAISQTDVDRGAAKFPGLTFASLNQGKADYETNCQACHALYSPAAKTEEQWRKIVPNMVKKANQNRNSVQTPIDSTMQESILRYVVTMCTAPPPPAKK